MKNEERLNRNKMGYMPIQSLLIKMSLPAIFSMAVQALYNIIDSIFVSRVSEEALTAVSMAFPIQMVIISICVGMGVSISSLVARKLGEKKRSEASHIAEHGIILMILFSIIIFILGFFLAEYFFSIFTDIPSLVEKGTVYIRIILCFSFGRLIAQAMMSLLQGTGDMTHPMKSQLIGAVGNIILDPILIFGYLGFPAMGIKGAAIATVAAQIISMAYLAVMLHKKEHFIEINLRKFKPKFEYIKLIFTTGYPVSIMQGLLSVMLVGMNWILSFYGELAVTVMGVYFKFQSFIFLPVLGMGQGALPIISYNFGAKSHQRMEKTVSSAIKMSLVYMIAGMLVFFFFPTPLINLFSPSKELLEQSIYCFQWAAFSFPFSAFGIFFANFFLGVGKMKYSLFLSFLRLIILIIPLSYMFGALWGLRYLWISFPVTEILAFIISLSLYKRTNNRLKQELS